MILSICPLLEQESSTRVQETSPSITSYSCVRSGAVTAYTAPNRSFLIRCSVRLVLINGSGFRHTIFRSVTQLLSIFILFEILTAAVACGPLHPCNGNHRANFKLLTLSVLMSIQVASFRNVYEISETVFWGSLRKVVTRS